MLFLKQNKERIRNPKNKKKKLCLLINRGFYQLSCLTNRIFHKVQYYLK